MMLKTKNFYLRPFQESDLNALYDLIKNGEIFDVVSPDFSEEKAKIILDILIESWKNLEFIKLAAFKNDSNEFVGYGGFELLADLLDIKELAPENDLIKSSGDLEFGIRVHKKFSGKGYGSELTAAICDWAFKEFPIKRIVALTNLENVAPQEILRKTGFLYAGNINSQKYGKEMICFIKDAEQQQ